LTVAGVPVGVGVGIGVTLGVTVGFGVGTGVGVGLIITERLVVEVNCPSEAPKVIVYVPGAVKVT
jgi:hypothetical protein